MKTVVTVNGETLPIIKCRQFDKGWYKIGNINELDSGDCYKINNRYYRYETDNVVYNWSINKYVLKDSSLMQGVINLNDTNEPVFGFFNRDIEYSKIVFENRDQCYLFDDKILEGSKIFREELSTGIYHHINVLPANKFNLIKIPKSEYKTSLPYDSKGVIDQYLERYNNNYNPDILENISKYSPILENLTFGLEFETTKGFIPNKIINNLGLIPLRDGSISGIEYVTVPLNGKKGLQNIVDVANTLKKRTEYDDTCSLHQHIGNIPRTKEFILAFFKITCAVQDELYTMFPLYKKYNFRVKNKNYSRPYPIHQLLSQMDNVINEKNINENFNVLYKYLSHGQDFGSVGYNLDNVKAHPADPQGNQKWMVKSRYYIHNMIPIIFGNKQTIEFRLHTPTYNVSKIMAFTLINSILVNYTIKNQDLILSHKGFVANLNLENIILGYINSIKISNRDTIVAYLFDYIKIRKYYTENQNCKGNIIGKEDLIEPSSIIDWEYVSKPKIIKNRTNISEEILIPVNVEEELNNIML